MEPTINHAVRKHEVTATWEYREAAQTCHRFFDIFNAEFFDGQLPTCFLKFERSRDAYLGYYRPGVNSVGARHEICLNTFFLERPLFELLATLLHEMAHQWQDLFGRPGKGNFHNKQFTLKCQSLGIPCTGGYRSYTLGYTNPFVSLVRSHDVDTTDALSPPEAATIEQPRILRGTSKLKKWTCGCTNIRAAVTVQARCLRCGSEFSRAD